MADSDQSDVERIRRLARARKAKQRANASVKQQQDERSANRTRNKRTRADLSADDKDNELCAKRHAMVTTRANETPIRRSARLQKKRDQELRQTHSQTLQQRQRRYYTQCMFQHTGQELADNLKVCMVSALRKYHEVNGVLPERIIVYRDGVGDGQLPAVVEHEVPQMMAAFKEQKADYKPKFAVVVVKKRINSRVMHESRGQLNNPPPGTIVDTEITKPEWYDFFLVSQSVRQGTVTPTHFNIIWDSTGLKPDHMQRLTYKLCHLYYNWPGTVRVPAPCQYAHKLAFLVGQSIHKEPSKDLADRLYFL